MGLDLLAGRQSRGDETRGDLFGGRALELVAPRTAHRKVRVRSHVHETDVAQPSRQRAAVGQVHAAFGHEDPESPLQPVGQFLGRASLVDADQRLELWIGLFDQEPTSGPQCIHHGGEGVVAPGDVDQHEPGVHEIERSLGCELATHVVSANLETSVVGVDP